MVSLNLHSFQSCSLMIMRVARLMTFGISFTGICVCQTNLTTDKVITAERSRSPVLPPYIVYRHFLASVAQLDKAATASRSADPYKFAEPFSRAHLEHPHLDILREAAHRLDTDLQKHQARAQSVIAKYRKQAKEAAAQGKPLPPAPAEIPNLERERTALLIHQYVTLRAALGPDASAQLDGYLGREFAPHIKLRAVAAPVDPTQLKAAN